MTREDRPSPLVRARFVANVGILGLAAPPARVRLKIVPGAFSTSLFIQPATAVASGRLVDWLEPLGPLRIEFGSRAVLRADFQPLPLAWEQAFRGLDVDMVSADPSGSATISVRGKRSFVAALARRLTTTTDPLEMSSVAGVTGGARLLTDPQDQALRVAVQAGYYLIPRPLNLKQLAKRLDISSASLSERLRRAEARVLTRYVNEGGTSPWDASTLFDSSSPHAGSADWPDETVIQVHPGTS